MDKELELRLGRLHVGPNVPVLDCLLGWSLTADEAEMGELLPIVETLKAWQGREKWPDKYRRMESMLGRWLYDGLSVWLGDEALPGKSDWTLALVPTIDRMRRRLRATKRRVSQVIKEKRRKAMRILVGELALYAGYEATKVVQRAGVVAAQVALWRSNGSPVECWPILALETCRLGAEDILWSSFDELVSVCHQHMEALDADDFRAATDAGDVPGLDDALGEAYVVVYGAAMTQMRRRRSDTLGQMAQCIAAVGDSAEHTA
jgi:hypothetical protein